MTNSDVLCASTTDVQQDPENETRSKFCAREEDRVLLSATVAWNTSQLYSRLTIEVLDIECSDSWVQFSTHEPIVNEITGIGSFS